MRRSIKLWGLLKASVITNVMLIGPVWTGVGRKFTGSTGIGIWTSAIAVYWSCGTGVYRLRGTNIYDRIENDWQGMKLVSYLQYSATLLQQSMTRINCCFIYYFNLQYKTVQHIQTLNTHSVLPSAHWVTVAVKSLTKTYINVRFLSIYGTQ